MNCNYPTQIVTYLIPASICKRVVHSYAGPIFKTGSSTAVSNYRPILY